MKKSILSIALSLVLVVSAVPAFIVGASADAPTVTHAEVVRENGSNLPWRLYTDGTLWFREGGTITRYDDWLDRSPWAAHSHRIRRVVFGATVTAGESVQALFAGLNLTAIEGLHHFNTSNTTNMDRMFWWTTIPVLNLSQLDTRSVTSVHSMFEGAAITTLNLSTFDMRNVPVAGMTGMFRNLRNIRHLTVGTNFRMNSAASLPAVANNTIYTGRWRNVGNGTVANPQGALTLTSAQFMIDFNPVTMADTWVWQRRDCAAGHIMSGAWQNVREATCTRPGRQRRFCARDCGFYEVRDVGALRHRMVNVRARAATVFQNGHNAHRACNRRGCNHVVGRRSVRRLTLARPPAPTLRATGGRRVRVTYRQVARSNRVQIQFRRAGTNTWTTQRVNLSRVTRARNRNRTLNGLTRGRNYQIRVRAVAYRATGTPRSVNGGWSRIATVRVR